MKRIILTGGGTAGHVTPNIALIPSLLEKDYEIHYIGSYEGIEKDLMSSFNVTYHGISSGKLRRYFSLQNFIDPFKIIKGFSEAKKLIKEIQPDVLFSKGGFVTVPVVKAAKKYKVPVIIHESDMTPGLANKLSFSSATKICCNFPETVELLPKKKAQLTGSPIRTELHQGNTQEGEELCSFTKDLPIVMIIGGSLGSVALNTAIRDALPEILEKYQIIHICGKKNVDEALLQTEGYKQFPYVHEELKDLFALSDVVISRAGANTICELLALNKPNLLIPLSLKASRGDQILNAQSFEKQGFSKVLLEEDLTKDSLLAALSDLFDNKEQYRATMSKSELHNAIEIIVSLIEEETANNRKMES